MPSRYISRLKSPAPRGILKINTYVYAGDYSCITTLFNRVTRASQIRTRSINDDRYVRIDARSQCRFKNSPHRLVIRGADTGHGVVNQALYSAVLVRITAVVAKASDVSPSMTLTLVQNSVGIRGSALLVAGIEVLRARVVLVSGRKGDRGLLETAQYRAFVQTGLQLILVQVYRLLREAGVRDPLNHLLSRLSQAEVQVPAPKHAVEILRNVWKNSETHYARCATSLSFSLFVKVSLDMFVPLLLCLVGSSLGRSRFLTILFISLTRSFTLS